MDSAPDINPGDLADILHKDHYTPEELAALLGINKHAIEAAAHSGELRATLLEHHIISIRREDVVQWIESNR